MDSILFFLWQKLFDHRRNCLILVERKNWLLGITQAPSELTDPEQAPFRGKKQF